MNEEKNPVRDDKRRKIRGASMRVPIANVIFNPKTPRANGYFRSKIHKKKY